MPRRKPYRPGRNPFPQQPSGLRCLGGDAPVSAARLCCPDCWKRLPPDLKQALSATEGVSPHQMTTPAFLDARRRAEALLTRHREMAR